MNYTDAAFQPSCAGVLIDDLESCDNQNVEFSVEVKNTGERDGSETILIYWSPPSEIRDAQIKELVAFNKVFVQAGQSAKVKFNLNACKSLRYVDYKGYSLLASGRHTIAVGDNILSFPFSINYEVSE